MSSRVYSDVIGRHSKDYYLYRIIDEFENAYLCRAWRAVSEDDYPIILKWIEYPAFIKSIELVSTSPLQPEYWSLPRLLLE